MNFIPVRWRDGAAWLEDVPLTTQSRATPTGDIALLGVRPEQLEARACRGENCVPARVVDVKDLGTHVMCTLEVAGTRVRARLADAVAARALTHLYIPPERSALYVDDWRLA
jgi:glycerol transport system ATP-binding protein